MDGSRVDTRKVFSIALLNNQKILVDDYVQGLILRLLQLKHEIYGVDRSNATGPNARPRVILGRQPAQAWDCRRAIVAQQRSTTWKCSECK